MNEQYIWPLAGVFLGWLLTTISTTNKERIHNKRLVGNLLAKLIRVERQVEILIASTEHIKDLAGSWEKYEPIRKGVSDRHFMEPNNVKNDLKAAIDAISPVYPLLAINLEDIYYLLLKNKSANLANVSKKDKESYIKMLSLYEVGLDLNQISLSKAINSLAFKHGIITLIKIKLDTIKRRKNLKNHVVSIVMNIIKESNEKLNSHNKSAQPTA